MKKFKRIVGITLMVFGGLGVFSFVGTAGKGIAEIGLGLFIMIVLFFAWLFYLGYQLYTAENRKLQKEQQTKKIYDKTLPSAEYAVAYSTEKPKPDNIENDRSAVMNTAVSNYKKIDLSGDIPGLSVTPGRSFFIGLLPGEKPLSEQDAVDADQNRPNTNGFTKLDTIGFPSRYSEYWYDPRYRRIVIDKYTANEKNGERWYIGRDTIMPLDLIDQYNQYPEDRNPIKVARIERIQKIMQQ